MLFVEDGMPAPPMSDEELLQRVNKFKECQFNMSEAARVLGIHRATLQHSMREAYKRGLAGEEVTRDGFQPKSEDYYEARGRRIEAYKNKTKKGGWRKPVMVRMPSGPFRLKLFGDPHLDANGCNYQLFEEHWLDMSLEDRVYGVCVGDWFNNWKATLSHLWKEESNPSDAWLCLEYLMNERGEALIAACTGNHDDWTHAPADPIDLLMKRHGTIYRKGAVRLLLAFDNEAPITIGIRHKWRGSSMYSAAHGILRQSIWGWRDHISVGGHIHQDESRMLVHEDGFKQHICQVSTFKELDEHVDIQGYQGPRISPVWDLVIDPAKPDGSADKIKVFWDKEEAGGYLSWLRSR